MSSSSNENITPIREEYIRLQEVEALLSEIWHCEVQAYEHSADDGNGDTTAASGLNTSASSSIGGHRNHPNRDGTITDPMVFPYHNSLYPLLDCYDSIKQAHGGTTDLKQEAVIPPSQAPNPFARNGHRRSKFSTRLDPQGFHIEELGFLEGHLPNSAWAIRETLMPSNRREEYFRYCLEERAEEESVQVAEHPEGEEGGATDLARPRFWKLLMNSDPKNTSSDVSLSQVVDENDNGEDESLHARDARDFTFLSWWEREIVSQSTTDCESKIGITFPSSAGEYSVERLLSNSQEDAMLVLLRVLKHAMSDLQRDFRLARAILLLVADWRLCEDNGLCCKGADRKDNEAEKGIETLRRLLIMISSEYVQCTGFCHEWYIENGGVNHDGPNHDNHHHDALNVVDEESIDLEETSDEDSEGDWGSENIHLNDSRALDSPTHYCSDWFEFLGSLSTVLSHGITYMTQQHISVICAFVLRELDYVVGASASDRPDDGQKGYLKQNLFLINNTDYDSRLSTGGQENWSRPLENNVGRLIRINLLLAVVNGLKRHAIVDRQCLGKLMHSTDKHQDLIARSLASFNTCVGAIVDIGERVLLKLPTNSQTCLLGGMVVRALLEVHLEDFVNIGEDQLYMAENGTIRLPSMIDPLRYASAISNASTDYHFGTATSQLVGQPSQDVQDVVMALFMRDLVDLRISGFGYGDFAVWFGLPLYPSPLLFDYRNNFPESSEVWAKDEEGADLDYSGLASRYDFSLLLFIREWNAPWTAASHLSFSLKFRSAVRQLALCAHRFGVPSDIVASVNSFLPRSWWPDDRSSCWCRDCQIIGLKDHYRDKIFSRQGNWSPIDVASTTPTNPPAARPKSPSQLLTCKCSVALACSREHMRYFHQEGHKRYCGLPPFRPFTEEDRAFCCDVLDGNKGEHSAVEYAEECFDGDGNASGEEDDDDWESVDSNEELTEERTRSQKILAYFEDKAYKYQRREALPFEDFF